MLRRSLFACALMLASVVGFASNGKAVAAPVPDTETVTMTGSVDNSCTVDNPVNGTLTPNTAKDILDSATGTAGKVDITCTGAASLEITSVTQTTGTTNTDEVATLTTTKGLAMFNSADTTKNKKITLDGSGLAKETATVDLIASNPAAGTALTAGTYTYNVLVTATPN